MEVWKVMTADGDTVSIQDIRSDSLDFLEVRVGKDQVRIFLGVDDHDLEYVVPAQSFEEFLKQLNDIVFPDGVTNEN